MSEEQLKAFIAKVQADASLLEQLKAEGADPVAIAKAAGFSITTEDIKTHRQNLSENELEGVAGGTQQGCWVSVNQTNPYSGCGCWLRCSEKQPTETHDSLNTQSPFYCRGFLFL